MTPTPRREMSPSRAKPASGTAYLQPGPDTAKLAKSRPGLTVAAAAKLMKVSERAVYMARAVGLRRPDLAIAVQAGTMSLSAAYALVVGKQKLSGVEKLLRAWNAATHAERTTFLTGLLQQDLS